MEEDLNQKWHDALLRHQIFALRVAGSIRNEVNNLLSATEKEIADQIQSMLAGDTTYTPSRLAKAQTALRKIKIIRSAGWDKADKVLTQNMTDFAVSEAEFLSTGIQTIVPVMLELEVPSAERLKALVREKPFEGRTLKEWAKSLRATDLRRMEDQIKIGLVQGEDSVRLARRIVGTVSLKGSDGVFELTRRNAEAITRTAVNYYSNAVRETWLADNSDLFTEELFVATLDSRTTPQCRSLDGKTFPIGKGPIPPLHFSCRSLRVASINGEAIGNRPAKPFTEKMFAKEFSNGEFSSRDALPRGMKDAYDSYARKRIREMTEIIPAKVTYQQWLGRQSVAFQDDVLGPTRGKLFRGGKVKLDKFVDRTGKTIPLAKLAKTDAAAFRAAGLDTGDYL